MKAATVSSGFTTEAIVLKKYNITYTYLPIRVTGCPIFDLGSQGIISWS